MQPVKHCVDHAKHNRTADQRRAWYWRERQYHYKNLMTPPWR